MANYTERLSLLVFMNTQFLVYYAIPKLANQLINTFP